MRFRIEAIEFRCPDQAIHGRGAFASRIRSSKQVVLSPQRDGTECAFGRVVVDLQISITAVT